MDTTTNEMMSPDPDRLDPVEGTEDTEQIRADIEQTRTELSSTIDAIQAKLSPENIKEQALDSVDQMRERVMDTAREATEHAIYTAREATIGRAEDFVYGAGDTVKGAGYTVIETIRDNPIPAALAALGIGWLIMEGRNRPPRYDDRRSREPYYRGDRNNYSRSYSRDRGYDYGDRWGYSNQGRGYGDYERRDWEFEAEERGRMEQARDRAGQAVNNVRDAASGAADRVSNVASDAASTVSDTASNVADTVRDAAGNVAERVQDFGGDARYQARRAGTRLEDLLDENPLAVGAVALAIGAAIGLAVPTTERERQLMGETRDNLMEKARQAAGDVAQKAVQVAEQTRDTIREEVEAQGLVENVKQTAQNVADSVKTVASEATQTAKEEAENQGLTSGGEGESTTSSSNSGY